MPASIKTARGTYSLKAGAPDQHENGALSLTLVFERSDGIERVALRCRITDDLLSPPDDRDALLDRLARWFERDFEMTRENALKTIRSERKMLELVFDSSNRGPF